MKLYLQKIRNSQIDSSHRVIFSLACLMVSTYLLANSIFLPALPAMRDHFMTQSNSIQQIIIVYTLGLGITQIIYGTLSDCYGRRKLVLLGAAIMLIGGLMTLISASLAWLMVGRLLQGLGAGCYSVLAKSIINDIYQRDRYLKASVIIMVFSVIAQIAAPLLGGYLTELFSWQSNFIVIAGYSFATLVALFLLLPETNRNQTQRLDFKIIYANYRVIFKNISFWMLLLISAFALSTITIYQMICPFILQDQMHLTTVAYGWASFTIASGFLIGNCCIPYLNHHLTVKKNILFGLVIMLSGVSVLLLLPLLNLNNLINPMAIVLPLLFFNIGTGLVFTLTTAKAVLEHPTIAGSASAVIGSLQMLIVAMVGAISAHLHIKSSYAFACLLLIVISSCWLCLFFLYVFDKSVSIYHNTLGGSTHET